MSKDQSILLERCRKGDERAMMRIYDLYCEAMFRIACRYLNDEDAKDAIQDCFLKAFARLDLYNEDFSFGSWLKRIVINHCIDQLKKRRLEFVDSEHLPLCGEDTSENWSFDPGITKDLILEAIERLPEKYRIVVKLYLLEGYDHEEISSIVQIPVKTSRTHLFRGRQQLRNDLKNTMR
jgi:RNA polymerase sigma factor (sigma-70 family)